MEALNRSLFELLNAGSPPSPIVFAASALLAQGLCYLVPLLLGAMWLWGSPRLRQAAFAALLAILAGLLANQCLNALWPQPRPFMLGLGHTYLAHRPESSFPSDHATIFFALAASLVLSGRPWAGLGALVGGLLVGWARVYLGLHFPLDVFGALLVGAGSAVGVGVLWVRGGGLGDGLLRVTEVLYRRVFALPIAKGWVRA